MRDDNLYSSLKIIDVNMHKSKIREKLQKIK